eukprot:TRINITY_DN20926_c2_g1_i1.p1 TRINITY_DN20926_c2_g1~~TRINITY_DN20926_c2_g1_i1.p1  ORF type:complete len:161 (-),score=13.20 TRINITY_DN20926_c2_g1_i1:783-1265(-)
MRHGTPGWDSRIRATACLNAALTNIELEFHRISNCNHWKYQSLLSFVSAYCFVVHGRHGSITMQALTSKHGTPSIRQNNVQDTSLFRVLSILSTDIQKLTQQMSSLIALQLRSSLDQWNLVILVALFSPKGHKDNIPSFLDYQKVRFFLAKTDFQSSASC